MFERKLQNPVETVVLVNWKLNMSQPTAQAQIQVPTTPVQLPPLPDTDSFLTPIGWAVLLRVILNSLFQDKK